MCDGLTTGGLGLASGHKMQVRERDARLLTAQRANGPMCCAAQAATLATL